METVKKYGPVVALVLFFAAAVFVANYFEDDIARFVEGRGALTGLIYFLIITVSTVLAPLSGIPLMPIVSTAIGPFVTACISVVGWSLGSYFIFILSRRYGMDVVRHFVSKKSVEKMKDSLPGDDDFWQLLLIRMLIPVDILSYALSLFTGVKLRTYMITTTLGVIPFAFVLAYVGTLPWEVQVGAVLVGVLVLVGIYKYKKTRGLR